MWMQVSAPDRAISQSELPVTFGLGTAARADEVTIVWPSGKT